MFSASGAIMELASNAANTVQSAATNTYQNVSVSLQVILLLSLRKRHIKNALFQKTPPLKSCHFFKVVNNF